MTPAGKAELSGKPRGHYKRISVPGVSLMVLVAVGCVALAFVAAWEGSTSPFLKLSAGLLLVGVWFLRTSVVSLFSWNSLLVVSNGVRDTYVPAEDILEVKLGPAFGPFKILTVGHRKKSLGHSWTSRVRTLVWKKTAETSLGRIDDLLCGKSAAHDEPGVV